MGVYIKGMQMPTDDNGKMEPTAVWVYPNGYAVVFKDNGNMKQYTQAIPISDHGDLIDRDTVMARAWDMETLFDAVKNAPAVIPEDREGEA